MKYELNKDNIKYIILSLIILLLILGIIFIKPKSNYNNIDTNTEINDYVIAMTDQDGNELTTMPSSGYTIDEEKSYCTVNGEKDTNAILKTINGNHTFANLQKGSKCYLVFIKTASGIIFANNITDTSRSSGSFTGVYTEDTSGKIFSGEDDYGKTYFFAGSNPNNWVSFASFYWRIVRINGDGTIRLIYNGTTDTTGENTQIGTSKYNSSSNDNAYVGYMYGSTSASTYSATHTNTKNSTIKSTLDSWYSSKLLSYEKYLDGNAGWCGDRTSTNSSNASWPFSSNSGGYGKTATYYGARNRMFDGSSWRLPETVTFKCSQSNDLYTIEESTYGNQALTYPIGLITADEVVYAGGLGGTSSDGYWLYTNQYYWTMSPPNFDGSYAREFNVSSDGGLNYYRVDNTYGVRPVINLKADTVFSSGNGTSSNPYVVKTS